MGLLLDEAGGQESLLLLVQSARLGMQGVGWGGEGEGRAPGSPPSFQNLPVV